MKTKHRKLSDSYFELVKRFPLRPIRTESEHREALAVVRQLVQRSPALDRGETDYLETLGALIEKYETSRWPIGKVSPLEALKFLMEEHDMRAVELGQVIGSQSAATMILKGDREPSKSHIRKLAERFNVSPALFL